jgi:hypothetical protein
MHRALKVTITVTKFHGPVKAAAYKQIIGNEADSASMLNEHYGFRLLGRDNGNRHKGPSGGFFLPQT